jgi:ech hydrogenase subunit F
MAFIKVLKLLLKSLFLEPATLAYPFKPRVYPANTRGHISIKLEDCIFCGMCQRKCVSQAITVTKEPKSWSIDPLRCVTCNYCVEVCPKKCLTMETQYSPAQTSK